MPTNPRGLTLSDLDRLSRVETVIIEPGHETNCTREQFRELVEAAKFTRDLVEGLRGTLTSLCFWCARGYPFEDGLHRWGSPGNPATAHCLAEAERLLLASADAEIVVKGASDAE